MHVVETHVRRLYRCKIIIVRKNLDDPISAARFWVTSELDADAQTCLEYISIRWDIETFFEDTKELLGIDQYQVMTATALLRYWILCWIAFSFLEQVREELKRNGSSEEQRDHHMEMEEECKIDKIGHENQEKSHATLGQAKRYVQEIHQELFLEWVYHHAFSGTPVKDLHALLIA